MVQAHKQERQAWMEPLQERAVEMISQLEVEKNNMAETQAKCTTIV
jgi:phosphoribosylanthranilate isomerase